MSIVVHLHGYALGITFYLKLTLDFCCCGPLTICLTLLFTQERKVTILDPLGSLNNVIRNTRNLTAALTVGKDSTLHQTLKYIKEFTQERNLIAVINVTRDTLIKDL